MERWCWFACRRKPAMETSVMFAGNCAENCVQTPQKEKRNSLKFI